MGSALMLTHLARALRLLLSIAPFVLHSTQLHVRAIASKSIWLDQYPYSLPSSRWSTAILNHIAFYPVPCQPPVPARFDLS